MLSFYINRINKIFKEQIGDLVDAVIILDNPLACFNRNNLKMYHKVLSPSFFVSTGAKML
uniref:Uncharacterized protein n=1 Tax=uncultured Desulfobacterium sp. TaxID=201089 RepID=E1YDA2_9BACT|nr:unknown protein [uncultured Desulfobacterium sp.]